MSIMGSIYTNPSELENIDWKERAETYLFDQESYRKECETLHKQLYDAESKNKSLWDFLQNSQKVTNQLKKKLDIALKVLKLCHDAIKSLPIEALGEGEIDYKGEPYKYPIRDEVIDEINKVLAEIERIGGSE